MRTITSALFALLLIPSALSARADDLKIEPASYPDNAAVAAAWRPVEGSGGVALAPEKTPDGRPAIAFTCDMSRVGARSYWDRQVQLNLAKYGRIRFWAKAAGDTTAISSATLYFNAGAGWYGSPFPLEDGWCRVTLDRASFQSEDTPEGWNAIRAIRLAFWKGQSTRAVVYLGGMEAASTDVAIVRNARIGRESNTWCEQMASMLTRAGIEAGTVDDADVERGVLAGKRIAIYPYNPQPSDREMQAVSEFVKAGGRLLVCFPLPPAMGNLLGIQDIGFLKQDHPGQFAAIRFIAGAGRPQGLPDEAKQASWNIQKVRPAGHNAHVLATWLDSGGKDSGLPAVILSDSGAYLSHVLLNDDPANKVRLLRGLLGQLCPEIWRSLADGAIQSAGRIGSREESFAQAVERVLAAASESGRQTSIRDEIAARARLTYSLAGAQRRGERYADAVDSADSARKDLLTAYVLAQKPKPGEFRAVWCHNAYGIDGLNWDQAIKRLKENGFTAIMPNILWGGVADYRSEVLPVRDRVAKEGDQIALCAAACRKYGLQMHVWKVNWNLGGAPDSFVERMRREGRLQRSSAGAEEPWLCPSNPANFQLERDSMLEVARKYDVTGIHFDYIRYPDSAHCYCEGCRKRFEELTGQPVADWPKDVLRGGSRYAAFQEFRRSNITRLVKAVSEGARQIKPGIKISAAVFPDWPQCREEVGQDWGAWVKAGYLDFVCPMDYTDSDSGFRSRVRVQRDAVAGRIPLIPGVGASAPGLPLGQVIDQIRITREEQAGGFIIFNYDPLVAADYIPALGKATTHP